MRRSGYGLFIALLVLYALPALGSERWLAGALPVDMPDEERAAVMEADELFGQREKTGYALKALASVKASSAIFPDSYDIHWRLSRVAFWIACGSGKKVIRREIAKTGWEAGNRALELRPDGIEGLYYMAASVGQYASLVGVVTAVRQGLEGKFRDPMLKAAKVDERVDNGGPWVALGRYKFEMPWPKRDVKQSIEWLEKALGVSPNNIRAKVYLAESLHSRNDAGDRKEATRILSEVLQAPWGVYPAFDRAEEMRARVLAAQIAERIGMKEPETSETP